MILNDLLSRSSLLQARLTLWQPGKGEGYRFNLDPVLLAGFTGPARHTLELGAGCGVLGLLLLKTGKSSKLTFVERQELLLEAIALNVEENDFLKSSEVRPGDLRHLNLDKYDSVVFNPPYYKADSGRVSQSPSRDAGRFERFGTLADFVNVAACACSLEGRISLCIPPLREEELTDLFTEHGYVRSRIRYVRSRIGDPVRLVLAEFQNQDIVENEKVETELLVHAPLPSQGYSDEVVQWLQGRMPGAELRESCLEE
ncbi:MAG: methyltransferase [Myxococcota bacterium]|nr:methyltransferase [Myxococcota bacterium]